MDENIGALEMSLGINIQGSGGVDKLDKELAKLNSRGIEGQKAFKDLFDGIRSATEATAKAANGATKKVGISKGDANTMISTIMSIAKAYVELQDKIKSYENIVSGYKTTYTGSMMTPELSAEINGIEQNIKRLKSQADEYHSVLSKFYTTNGNVRQSAMSGLTSQGVAEFKRLTGMMMEDTKAYDKNVSDRMKNAQAVERGIKALEDEYVKYSNLAKGAIMTIDRLVESANTRLYSSERRFGVTDASKNLQQSIEDLKTQKKTWEVLLADAKSSGTFTEASYRNAYLSQRQFMTDLSINRSLVGQSDISKSRNEADRRESERDYNKYASYCQRVMSQNDKLVESYEKIYAAQKRLSQASVGVTDKNTQNSIQSQMRYLYEYADKLQGVWGKLGDKLAFRGADGTSLVGAEFKSLINESNALALSLEKTAAAREKDAQAAEKQAQSNALSQAAQGNKAWTAATDKAQIEGEKARSAQLKQQMEERFKAEEEASKASKKAAEEALKSQQQQSKALDDYLIKRNTVTKTIDDLKRKSDELNMSISVHKAYGLDTTQLETAKRELDAVISRYEAMKNMSRDTFMQNYKLSSSNLSVDKNNAVANTRTVLSDALHAQRDYNKAVIADTKAATAASKEREEQEKKLESAIRKLNHASELSNNNKFTVDTTRLDNAKKQVETVLDMFRKYDEHIKNGGLVTPGFGDSILSLRKDALSEYGIALAETKARQRDFDKSVREGNASEATRLSQQKQVNSQLEAMKTKLADVDRLNFKYADKNTGYSGSESIAIAYKNLKDLKAEFDTLKNNLQSGKIDGTTFTDFQMRLQTARAELERAIKATKEYEAEQAKLNKPVKTSTGDETTRISQLKEITRLLNSVNQQYSAAEKKNYLYADATAFNTEKKNLLDLRDLLAQTQAMLQNGAMSKADFTGITLYADTVRKLYEAIKKAANEEEKLLKQKTTGIRKTHDDAADAAKRHAKEVASLINQYKNLQTASNRANSSFSDLKNMLMQFAPVYGLQQMVMSVIEVGGEIEKQHIALQSILGDLQNANELFGEIKELALQSPFTFGELNKDVKQLAAYGVEYNDLYDTTKRLADISSGLGVSFERIALAYGQVKSRSWLDGKELRQFAYAGIPLLQRLSEMYSDTQGKVVNTAQVRKMVTNREVSFEDVQKVLWQMTEEGGQFYDMQTVLADTLLGRYNKLKDAWEIMLSGFAKGDSIVGGTFKFILDSITKIVLLLNSAAPAVAAFFSGFALNKLGMIGSVKANTSVVNNVLSAQKGAASKILERENMARLNGETYKRTRLENQILESKGRVSAAYVRELALAGKINQEELKRLWISKQLTNTQYKGISKNMGWDSSSFRSISKMKFAISGIGSALKSAGSGILSFFGGPVGIAIGASLAAITYFYSKSQEMKDRIKGTGDEIIDRYKQVSDFIIKNPINLQTATPDEIAKSIETYREELKDKLGDMYGISLSLNGNESDRGTMRSMHDAIKKYIKAIEDAKENASLFEEAADKASGLFEESVITNVKDYTEAANKVNSAFSSILKYNNWDAINEYIRILESSDKGSFNMLAEKMNKAKQEGKSLFDVLMLIRDSDISRYVKVENVANPLHEIDQQFGKMEWNVQNLDSGLRYQIPNMMRYIQDELNRQGKSITSDTGIMMFNTLMQSFFSQNEVPKEAQRYFSVFAESVIYGFNENIREFTNNMGSILPSSVAQIAERTMSKLDNTLKEQLRNNETLSEESKKKMKESIDKAYDEWLLSLPPFIAKMQRDLNKHKLYLSVETQLTDGNSYNDYQNWALDKAKNIFGDSYVNGAGSVPANAIRKNLVDIFKDGKTLTEAQKANDDLIEKAETEIKRIKKEEGSNQELLSQWEKTLQERKDVRTVIGKTPDKDKKGKTPRDWELEALEKEAKAVEKLIEVYKKYRKLYGSVYAGDIVKAEAEKIGLGEYDFSKPVDARQMLADKFLKLFKNSRKEFKERRESDWQLYDAKAEEEEFNKEDETIKSITKSFDELNSRMKTQYELRESIRKKYGSVIADTLSNNAITYTDSKGAVNMILGDSFEKTLEEELSNAIKEAKDELSREMSIDEVLSLDDEKIRDAFGDTDRVMSLIKNLRDERMRLQRESVDILVSQLDSLENNAIQIQRIYNDLNDTISKINNITIFNEDGSVNDEKTTSARNNARSIATANANTKALELTSEYQTFFENILYISEKELESTFGKIVENLKERLATGTISQKQFSDVIGKVYDAMQKRIYNPDGFMGGTSNASMFMKGGIGNLLKRSYNDLITSYMRYDGTDTSKKEISSNKKRYEELKKTNDYLSKIIDGLSLISTSFSSVSGVLSATSDMMGSLGNTTAASRLSKANIFVEGIGNAFNSLQSFASAYQNGDANAMIQSGGQFIQELAKSVETWAEKDAKDKDIQIKNVSRTNMLLDNIYQIIKNDLDGLVGKLYSWDSDMLRDGLDRLYNAIYDNGVFEASDETKAQYDKAKTTGSYYDFTLARLMAERDNYKLMAGLEHGKKAEDPEKYAEYENEVENLNEEIKNLSKTMASELYGIDFENYAKTIASSLVNAWAEGTNSVKAYKDAVSDALKNVTQNVIEQKVIGTYIDTAIDGWLKEFENKGGIMDEGLYSNLAGIFVNLEDRIGLAKTVYDELKDIAKSKGYDWENKSKSSTSSGITSVTEDTAEILASYINAIRADVGVNRAYLQDLTENKLTTIGKDINLSYEQLKGIRSTLDATLSSVQNIEGLLDDFKFGNQSMHVVLKNVS